MTKEEIYERNIQIAQMLNWKEDKRTKGVWHDPEWVGFSYLDFNFDWNNLMRAVDFIERLKIGVYIGSNNCIIQTVATKENNFTTNTLFDVYGKTKIESVFIAVSDHAKIYNFLNFVINI